MTTTRERAIAATVLHAALDDHPLTLDELHRSLIGSQQTRAEVISVYEGSEMLRRIVEHRDGFFFLSGRSDLVDERRRREARSRAFLDRHGLLLRLVCCLPFVRLVALSGRVAQLNLEAGGDIDLFIVTRPGHVWSTATAVQMLSKLLSRRCMVRAKVVVDDKRLAIASTDLESAARLLWLRPLMGAAVLHDLHEANPFVVQFFPNAPEHWADTRDLRPSRLTGRVRTMLALLLGVPSPLIERACRRWQHGGDTLVEMPRRHRHDDLFQIFPDLPGYPPRSATEIVRRVQQQVEVFRERARISIDRQRASAGRLRARALSRKRR